MARIRTIKPEFFLHERLAELSALHRLLFIGLWTLADRDGRLEDRPKRIKAAILPYDTRNVDAMLGELAKAGFITRYAGPDGGKYIEIPAFSKHQRIQGREAAVPSRFPAPIGGSIPESSGNNPISNTEAPENTGREGKGKECVRGMNSATPPTPVEDAGASPAARRRAWLVHESAIGADVPTFLHTELLNRLRNMGDADADQTLRRWYHVVEQSWRGRDPGDKGKFWRARFDEQLAAKARSGDEPKGLAATRVWTCRGCGGIHEGTAAQRDAGWCANEVPA